MRSGLTLNYFFLNEKRRPISSVDLNNQGVPCDGLYDVIERSEKAARHFEHYVAGVVSKDCASLDEVNVYHTLDSEGGDLTIMWWLTESEAQPVFRMWRCVWSMQPYDHNTPRVLYVRAETKEEARLVAKGRIEKRYEVPFNCYRGAGLVSITEVDHEDG